MKILFLTLIEISSIEERGIYHDLMRKFRDEGHELSIVSATERRNAKRTKLSKEKGVNILQVWTFNIQKAKLFEKALGMISIDHLYFMSINKYFKSIKFDLVLYSTPPITFTKVINRIKKRDGAKTYLLLKDIFPQNAVDLGMMKENGVIHSYFRRKEKILYEISDHIGCMSPANVTYFKKHNPQISPTRVEENPNSIDFKKNFDTNIKLIKDKRRKYNIPINSIAFLYGGNFGKPQGLDFMLKVIESNSNNSLAFFVLVGSGTEYGKIRDWFNINNPTNALLLQSLPKVEYDQLVNACDIGLIFLDPRFTIPNFPSRLLSYLENKMPIIASIDKNSDIGSIAQENGFGYSVLNGDLRSINKYIEKLSKNNNEISSMGKKGYDFLRYNYSVQRSYDIIISHF